MEYVAQPKSYYEIPVRVLSVLAFALSMENMDNLKMENKHNKQKWAVLALILSLSWILGCDEKVEAPIQQSKDFYIYTTGFAYDHALGHSVRLFKEFIKTHSNILETYSVHIIHYDPDFNTLGVNHWQLSLGNLPLKTGYDQTIKAEWFGHEVKQPHIVLDGADIYGQKIYRTDTNSLGLKTVLHNAYADNPDYQNQTTGAEMPELKALYLPLYALLSQVQDPLFCVDKTGKIHTVLDAALLVRLGDDPNSVSEGNIHFGYNYYQAENLYGMYLSSEGALSTDANVQNKLNNLCN
jgi:hypothetical protein